MFTERTFGKCSRRLDSDVWEANGNLSRENINYSGLLTRLIQEAGRYCRYYASDLFIYWSNIVKELEDGTINTRTEYFGFRSSGVDHITNPEKTYCTGDYITIWKLEVDVSEYGEVKMKLYEVS